MIKLRKVLSMCAATLVVFAVQPVFSIEGQAAEEKKKPQKTRRVPSMSESVYKRLAEAQEAIDLKDNNLAIELLEEMLNRSRRFNGNEIGQVRNMLGYVWFLKEDYLKAIEQYKLVVAQGEDIPEGLESTTLYTLAQLSFVEEAYQDALDYMEIWITKADNPGPQPRIFMGQVYYQMKEFDKAVVQIEMGIAMAIERGTDVKENWWQLANFLHYENENWPRVLEILEIMVQEFPKREYWIQLAGVHGTTGDEKSQLHTMETAYAGDFLTKETDLTNLAGLLMQEEVAFRAALVLEKGIEEDVIEASARNLRSLGQAWQLSQEVDKAIPVFEDAAKLADDGKIFERLAYLYLEADKFSECVTAANGALNKGGLSKRQSTYVVRGMCLFNQDNLNDARGSFVSCRNESRKEKDSNNQRICASWITYIDREKIRLQKLAEAS
ncbi:MAG: hypothetical protein P8L31_01245 [Pseudomonadales bacterium]|nr:hypothetical protein [Pseudomonadales bacterium]